MSFFIGRISVLYFDITSSPHFKLHCSELRTRLESIRADECRQLSTVSKCGTIFFLVEELEKLCPGVQRAPEESLVCAAPAVEMCSRNTCTGTQ